VRAGWIQNRLIPIKPFSNAAIRPRRRRSSGCQILQFRGDDVLWVPELTRSVISDTSERPGAWRPPVRREDWLPHDEHPHLSICLPRQQLLSCGGPPQTSGSSRRQQQNQARNIGFGVERFLEVPETCLGKRKNRLLAVWR
jgi:hypothetical protein